MIPRDVKQNVLKELQETYGKDLLDLKKCTAVYNELLQQKVVIEQDVSPIIIYKAVINNINPQYLVEHVESRRFHRSYNRQCKIYSGPKSNGY